MADYKKLYYLMFAGAADAAAVLEKTVGETPEKVQAGAAGALCRLARVQRECEEIYIEEGEK